MTRYSILDGDPGRGNFDPVKFDYEIYIDGEIETGALIADEDLGFVLRYKKGLDGEVILAGDIFARETVHGEVRVVVTDRSDCPQEEP